MVRFIVSFFSFLFFFFFLALFRRHASLTALLTWAFQASTHDVSSRPNFEMLHKAPRTPILPGSTAGPPSDTTEIFDTDFDSDYNDEYDGSRRTSAGSVCFLYYLPLEDK